MLADLSASPYEIKANRLWLCMFERREVQPFFYSCETLTAFWFADFPFLGAVLPESKYCQLPPFRYFKPGPRFDMDLYSLALWLRLNKTLFFCKFPFIRVRQCALVMTFLCVAFV